MTQSQKIGLIVAIVLVPALMLIGFNALVVQPSLAPRGGTVGSQALNFPTDIQDLRVSGDAEFGKTTAFAGAMTLNSTLNTTGAATFGSTASFAGAVTLSTNIIHSSTSITPTDGGILTPTAKLVTLTPAGAVGIQLGACTTGNETVLYNSVNANVVITDTGNGLLAGNQTLGQYDALLLACYATKWVQISAVSAN